MATARSSLALLRQLEALKAVYDPGAADRKRAALARIDRLRLPSAAAVQRLHELLCWWRAYPDDAALLAQVDAMLARFADRPDLRAQRAALADSGIAGTAIRYRFFAGQAAWLAARWPLQLTLLRDDPAAEARLALALQALLTPAEAAAQIERRLDGFELLDRVRGPHTDAAFVQQRLAALPLSGHAREAVADALDLNQQLSPGPGTPSRTHAVVRLPRPLKPVFRHTPPPRLRPDLRVELLRAPQRVRRLSQRDAEGVIDQARGAMVTRARSLEAFSFADPREVWWVDDGDGLAFALMGVEPARRHPLATLLGGLTLRNGVPIGYVQSDLTGRSAALSFNTFETFRGGEAAWTFARWLSAVHHLYGSTSFHIEPYQLGLHNDEALASGAWWFYARLGFAPRDAAVARRAQAERLRLQRQPGARSSADTLRVLASRHLHFDLGPPLPRIDLAGAVLRSAAALAAGGQPREAALQQAAHELALRCGVARLAQRPAVERAAWALMAPWLLQLPLHTWSDAERAALADVVRLKAGRGERGHVGAWLAHPRLDADLGAWAGADTLFRSG